MKIKSFFMIILGAVLVMTSCNQNITSKGENVVSVYLSSAWHLSYRLVLNENKTYTVTKGEESDSAQTTLSDKNYTRILDVLENMGEFEGEDCYVTDVWAAKVNFSGESHYFTYGCSINEKYDLLVTELIKLSPLEEVKTIKPYNGKI